MKKTILKNISCVYWGQFYLVVIFSCTQPLDINYTPPVIFSGYINGDYAKLKGNRNWKNSCEFISDTLRMYFYSTGFNEENKIRCGDLLRIDIYPGENQLVGTSRTLFHMARYNQTNSSYTVRPSDTLNSSNCIVQMSALSMGAESGDSIILDKIYIKSSPESGTHGGLLEIKDGRIEGVVE